jgi:hypothetical protein
MELASAIQNARHTAQAITWTDADGDPQNLTGATLTGRILPASGTGRAIDGTLTITGAAAGQFTWAYGTNDVASAGSFYVQFVATYADTKNDKTIKEAWVVKPEIVVP